MAQAKRSRPSQDITPTHPGAAAIDIGATMHVAAVDPDQDPDQPVRSFGTFTGDLHRLADWFQQCGVRTVAMESTGVYWIPAFELLDQRGFEVVLVNARDAKHVPGRKTDISDAQWLQRLHAFGLLRASFRPKGEIATLRAYLRLRERLLDSTASHIQHMQKALTQMNLQLHHVVTDITGVTGMAIIRAIVAGERDPATLAALRDPRCHATVETICQALVGNDREEHVFALTQAVELYDFYQTKIADCDTRIQTVLQRLRNAAPVTAGKLPSPRHKTKQPNAMAFDVRAMLHGLLGCDLTQIHGLGPSLALKLVGECGTDLAAWPDAKHFTSWLCLACKTRFLAVKSCQAEHGALAVGPLRCYVLRQQPWAARRQRWVRFIGVCQLGWAKPRRSLPPPAKSRCCSTTPCVTAWTMPIPARRTTRSATSSAFSPT